MSEVYGIADNLRCKKTGKAARMLIDAKNQIIYQCLDCRYEGSRDPHFEFTTASGTILSTLFDKRPRKITDSEV